MGRLTRMGSEGAVEECVHCYAVFYFLFFFINCYAELSE
jgi:hypothetical protein